MDYHLKTMKLVPPPSHYCLKDAFDQKDNKKQGKGKKIDGKLIK